MDVSRRIELIGKHMVEVLIDQLKNGQIVLMRAQQVGQYYLDRIRTAGTHTELSECVQTMLTEVPEMQVVVRSDKIRMMKLAQQQKTS